MSHHVGTRCSFFGVLVLVGLIQSPGVLASDDTPLAGAALYETTVFKTGYKDHYKITAGEFDKNNVDRFVEYFSDIVKKERQKNPLLYVEVNPLDHVLAARTPQTIKSSPPAFHDVSKKIAQSVKGVTVNPTQKFRGKLAHWMHDSDNKIRLSFAIVAGSLDGTATVVTLLLFNHVTVPVAMTVGGVVAAMSASWSLYTPQIAKFLNNKPSLVNKLFEIKKGIAYTSAHWMEGLFKWGLISLTYTSVLSAVSYSLDIMSYATATEWFLTNLSVAGMVTLGQGIFDYSLSVELDRSVSGTLSKNLHKRALLKTYYLGTLGASLIAFAALGSLLGYDYGDYMLVGLTTAGVVNLAIIERESIVKFISNLKVNCMKPLKRRTY